jgi:hypothetical protein
LLPRHCQHRFRLGSQLDAEAAVEGPLLDGYRPLGRRQGPLPGLGVEQMANLFEVESLRSFDELVGADRQARVIVANQPIFGGFDTVRQTAPGGSSTCGHRRRAEVPPQIALGVKRGGSDTLGPAGSEGVLDVGDGSAQLGPSNCGFLYCLPPRLDRLALNIDPCLRLDDLVGAAVAIGLGTTKVRRRGGDGPLVSSAPVAFVRSFEGAACSLDRLVGLT